MRILSDLAHEIFEGLSVSEDGVTLDITEEAGVKRYLTRVTNARGARRLGKPIGMYSNIEGEGNLIEVLAETLREFITETGAPLTKLLVIGLGNNRFVADSLGPLVCKFLMPVTRKALAVFPPNVSGMTGIQSTDAIKAIATAVQPSHVLVIDSLCCHERARLGNNFQVSSTGITPGSGVGRDNKRLDTKYLGVPVIALGVPLVIYLPKLYYVVPKNIDLLVEGCAKQIAKAVETVVQWRHDE